jgi:hypothetical protein
MDLNRSERARLAVLEKAPLNKWIALSADETSIVAEGNTFEEVAAKVEALEDEDILMIRVPPDWTPRVF